MPVESWMMPDDVPGLAAQATDSIDAVLARLDADERAAFWASVRKCYNTPYNDPKPRSLPTLRALSPEPQVLSPDPQVLSPEPLAGSLGATAGSDGSVPGHDMPITAIPMAAIPVAGFPAEVHAS